MYHELNMASVPKYFLPFFIIPDFYSKIHKCYKLCQPLIEHQQLASENPICTDSRFHHLAGSFDGSR